ncbi:MAG TPA: nucleoside hydrolase [SAR86 cluster bacterium]|nr:nucleoside hydrolase [SAR86 cluster bacterium]
MEQLTPILKPEENELSAPSFIAKTCVENSGDIELVTIGPLTNVAKALDEEPNLSKHIKKITMMAGAAKVPGNVTPAAEFNVWADPESASKVFGAGIDFMLVPLDVCHKTRFGRDQLKSIGENPHPFCQFVNESVEPWLKMNPNHNIIDQGLHLYDSLAMALCFAPELAEFKEAYVTVETKGEYTDGETVCEFNESIMGQVFKPKHNAEVALDINVEGFNKLFEERVLNYLINL